MPSHHNDNTHVYGTLVGRDFEWCAEGTGNLNGITCLTYHHQHRNFHTRIGGMTMKVYLWVNSIQIVIVCALYTVIPHTHWNLSTALYVLEHMCFDAVRYGTQTLLIKREAFDEMFMPYRL